MAAATIIGNKIRRLSTTHRPADKFQRPINSDEEEGPGIINTLPQPLASKHYGTVYRLVTGTVATWKERVLALTDTELAFGKPDSDLKIDFIPLEEVETAHPVSEAQQEDMKGMKTQTVSTGSRKINMEMKGQDVTKLSMGDKTDGQCQFLVTTVDDGFNSGRSYCLRTETQAECERWCQEIRNAVSNRRQYLEDQALKAQQCASFVKYRQTLQKSISSTPCQMGVAVLILVSFGFSLWRVEVRPATGTQEYEMFEAAEAVFTTLFALELAVNMVAQSDNYMVSFFRDGWNCFDALVVLASVISLIVANVPGLSSFRLLRVFRIMRIFRKFSSLRQLVNALGQSVVPVINAFIIVGVVTTLFAIFATELFGDYGPKGREYFGSFSRAMFSMFQIATVDGWGLMVRGLWKDGEIDHLVNGFFVIYMVTVAIVLLNIVVAVLLDEFICTVSVEKEMKRQQVLDDQMKVTPQLTGPLDPLMEVLSYFSSPEDLSARIGELYQMLDVDESHSLAYEEMMHGLKKIKTRSGVGIHFSQEDWLHILSEAGIQLQNENDEIEKSQFEHVIRSQLLQYVYRRLVNSMQRVGPQEADMLVALKLLLSSPNGLSAPQPLSHGRLVPNSPNPARSAKPVLSAERGREAGAQPPSGAVGPAPSEGPSSSEGGRPTTDPQWSVSAPDFVRVHSQNEVAEIKSQLTEILSHLKRMEVSSAVEAARPRGHVTTTSPALSAVDLLDACDHLGTRTLSSTSGEDSTEDIEWLNTFSLPPHHLTPSPPHPHQHLAPAPDRAALGDQQRSQPHQLSAPATQPLSNSATQPLSLSKTQPVSHSAPQPLSPSSAQLLTAPSPTPAPFSALAAQPLSSSAPQPLSPSAPQPQHTVSTPLTDKYAALRRQTLTLSPHTPLTTAHPPLTTAQRASPPQPLSSSSATDLSPSTPQLLSPSTTQPSTPRRQPSEDSRALSGAGTDRMTRSSSLTEITDKLPHTPNRHRQSEVCQAEDTIMHANLAFDSSQSLSQSLQSVASAPSIPARGQSQYSARKNDKISGKAKTQPTAVKAIPPLHHGLETQPFQASVRT